MHENVFNHAEQDEINKLTLNILNHSLVFVADQSEHSICLGSGTLLRFGEVSGILTCGHVLKVLRNRKRIRVSLHGSNSNQRTLNSISLSEDNFVSIGDDFENLQGPDLGFLRLDTESTATIASKLVFLNGANQRERARRGCLDSDFSCDFICGSVEEINTKIETNVEIVQQLNAGQVTCEESQNKIFDYFKFNTFDSEPLNHSHRGTSGGGWWRLDFDRKKDGILRIVEKNLLGVAFAETGGKPNIIRGHGPKSIYENLRRLVEEQFTC
jgi:hypothetical protein